MADSISWELKELKDIIKRTCNNNISHGTKALAYSCLATIKRKFEEKSTETKTKTKNRKEN